MNIIKLNAIDSTNVYLKKIALLENCNNFTTVVATTQLKGRGQMGTTWQSEEGKNLTFSTLIKFKKFNIVDQFYISMAVSLAIVSVLNDILVTKFSVKWPNDIMAEKDKVAGILIENVIKGSEISMSIIGIGLNVNQQFFPNDLYNATSLKLLSKKEYDLDFLLDQILKSIRNYSYLVQNKKYIELKESYLSNLYKFNVPTVFEDKDKLIFMGKIIDITEEGKLEVLLENEKTRKFDLKEIKFASF
ncbi:biotin--[acetyl-CoA-carboxylase] ligase [Lutibacter sp.]|uniref:biotin--[acetyl-CoA-carboxylase] ligase n=1 Tax=Lutibacter sp. TaxID=1925666 RepID=UPI002734ED33|nr:biotin--[acetyl-CoA-carboxylase] ligase [Lutibacter sp.]MDP3312175.1 biotin--[acetyl-CoA-carboxylase] ligase [Lutibacter sp.]